MHSRYAWDRSWRSVSRLDPCRVCGKPDWCRASRDGTIADCYRVNTGGVHRVDKAGVDYWRHRLGGVTRPARPSDEPLRPRDSQCADADALHQGYSVLLGWLPLAPRHRQNLHQRGLDDGEIARRQYHTLPRDGRAALARHLVERFDSEFCRHIPGISLVEREGRRWWSLPGASGLLIPVRDLRARIIALLVRRDDPEADPRYVVVSSTRYGGPGPGAPCHIPLSAGLDPEPVRLTEGPLKGDVTTALSRRLTLGLPGATAWRSGLPLLQALGTHTVHLAFDADADHKWAVARTLWQTAKSLHTAGFTVLLEHWDEAQGKGMDPQE